MKEITRGKMIRKGMPMSAGYKPPAPPDTALKQQIDQALNEVIQKTRRESIRLTLSPGQNRDTDPAGRFKSKFGGMPYWPANKPYPVGGRDGKSPMVLLAQINFAEMPRLAGYPTKGILQFFCANVDWYSDNSKRNALTIYHPNVSPNDQLLNGITRTSCNYEETAVDKWDWLPFDRVFYIKSKVKEVMSAQPSSIIFDEMFTASFNRIGPNRLSGYNELSRTVWNYVFDAFKGQPSWGHRIGGWPNFVQNDMMDRQYDTLLLQIDSERGSNGYYGVGDGIMWGDLGIANTFINHNDLARLNFGNVLYTWDCG